MFTHLKEFLGGMLLVAMNKGRRRLKTGSVDWQQISTVQKLIT
jgi:hypothetical protein